MTDVAHYLKSYLLRVVLTLMDRALREIGVEETKTFAKLDTNTKGTVIFIGYTGTGKTSLIVDIVNHEISGLVFPDTPQSKVSYLTIYCFVY